MACCLSEMPNRRWCLPWTLRTPKGIRPAGKVIQETRLYNGETRKARSMRTKEEANDYRYFPDPDLLPVALDEAFLEAVRLTVITSYSIHYTKLYDPLGGGAHDVAVLALGRHVPGYQLLQAHPLLLLLDALGDPHVTQVGHEHEVTGGDGDLGGEACPLGAERVLDDLHRNLLAFMQQLGDIPGLV